jgi:hypothetical protein
VIARTHGAARVDGQPLLSIDDDLRTRMMIGGQYQAPAYARRALGVQQAYDDLIARCARQRDEWLRGVRLHLGFVRDAGGPQPGGDVAASLAQLAGRAEPPRALAALRASVACFNRRWSAFIAEVDLSEVNRRRDGYNRYYLIEKECALGSPRIAAIGFRRLAPLTADDVMAALPLLAMPSAGSVGVTTPPRTPPP